jgi:hypothetical protein
MAFGFRQKMFRLGRLLRLNLSKHCVSPSGHLAASRRTHAQEPAGKRPVQHAGSPGSARSLRLGHLKEKEQARSRPGAGLREDSVLRPR